MNVKHHGFYVQAKSRKQTEQNWRQNSAANIYEFKNHVKWEKLHTYYAEYSFNFERAVYLIKIQLIMQKLFTN